MSAAPALQVQDLCMAFGGLQVTRHVDLALPAGARHALIGPNGAGKTTLVNQLTGVLQPSSGTIRLAGEDITALPVHERVRRGLARTFQINSLFAGLTPLESVVAAIVERRGQALGLWRRCAGGLARCNSEMEEAYALLERLGLGAEALRRTGELAYGKQRLLELALALATQPRVLLLDEPAAGVPQAETEELLAALDDMARDMCVLLIEHDMSLVFRFAQRITVLVDGAELMTGTAAEVAADDRVREVYLGRRPHG